MTRLDELLNLRAQIDTEIDRERSYQYRVTRLRGHITDAVTTTDTFAQQVILATADHYDVEGEDIVGRSKVATTVRPRWVVAWLLRESGRAFTNIGRILNRDHSTVIHACRQVDLDPALLATAIALRDQLLGEGAA